MNHEQKYKNALQRAREYKKHGYMMINVALDNIFPELRESEDERIRNQIINFIEEYGNPIHCEWQKDWIAWLEKQGDEKSKDKCDCLKQMNGEKVAMATMDEQKSILCKNDISHIDSLLKRLEGLCRNEFERTRYAISEDEEWLKSLRIKIEECKQEEPKFKVGDWIVWQDKCYKVNYNGCGYELVDQNGLSTSLEYGTIDENAHLWTIADAKPGDVLYSPYCNLLWIYKDEKTCYVGNNLNYHSDSIVVNNPICIPTDTRPATQEQCDLLFQKMKEAGYRWDAENKEINV